ncbi:uncharacterized protein SPPG_06906 [Spizellomyces punctatus DAOM BR117]|uniref:ATP-dependent RNA helicase n=1 Tax=Spizellomyces punctatus (strain DAOM BR117) TaxID=645134 RepID=A0A0L0HA72_SPIPD|nr:uncharacterized protein SPPG_06906 [Spizellomyces punctatus DAOM BR117]KNC97916.1 hypothetical protein SPPG_06906 [Spizellomyces punctatus DAOM BR117]|eukprot:XP_016605956.1 hypothetical protein SPPG_06906 [Spizellomyces punctatus DAOM BR117]
MATADNHDPALRRRNYVKDASTSRGMARGSRESGMDAKLRSREEGQGGTSRKRPWEKTVESEVDTASLDLREPKARKKKRGGKHAKEKELKWKIAHGLVDADNQNVEAVNQGAVATLSGAFHPHNSDNNVNTALDDGVAASGGLSDATTSFSTQVKRSKPSKTAGLPAWISNPLTIPAQITKSSESDVADIRWGLSPRILARLREKDISHLFPVQMAVLPRLLKTRHSSASIPPGDICVSAPTGSGKTLAYALPIVEALLDRIIPRLRALVVLPTRDLAAQVKATFDMLLRGSDLRALLITGQTPFALEQQQLVASEAWEVATEEHGSGKVDIVVATPGRLMDHLRGTKGFTLRHLRYLVIDEADRLLNQSYQDWLTHVLAAAVAQPERNLADGIVSEFGEATSATCEPQLDENEFLLHKTATWRRSQIVDGKVSAAHSSIPSVHHYTPLQKLLFSATLTRNPAKIASLNLYDPVYIAVAPAGSASTDLQQETVVERLTTDARFVAPHTLSERMIVCTSAGEKPLMLLHLLCNLGLTGALVFTKSVEAAHRLAALLQLFSSSYEMPESSSEDESTEGGAVKEAKSASTIAQAFSSDLPPSERKRLLSSFRDGKLTALICSDVMARGMDLGESVKAVVNYDVPTRVKTYVHRIGRTARAGRVGVAYTILEDREVRWFKGEMAKVERSGSEKVEKLKVVSDDVEGLTAPYQKALAELGGLVKGNHVENEHPGGSSDSESDSSDNESDTSADEISGEDTVDSGSEESEEESGSPQGRGTDDTTEHSMINMDREVSVSDSRLLHENTGRLEAALKSAAEFVSSSGGTLNWWS